MKRLKKQTLNVRLEAHASPLVITFGELISLYLSNISCNGRSRPFRVRKWIDHFGHLAAWDFTAEHLGAMVEALEEADYKPSTINREVTDIRSAYSWVIKRRRAPEGLLNPARDYERREEAIRRVELSDEEVDALLAACKLSRWPKLYALVLMALHSGARNGELMNLTWDDIDFDNRRAMLHQSKSGKPRNLQLTQLVVDALRAIQPTTILDGLVFCGKNPYKPHHYRSSWTAARSLASLDDLHFHDLRHVAAARLLKAGTNLLAVTQILGHVDTRMLSRRYGHLDDHHLLSAVDKTWTT